MTQDHANAPDPAFADPPQPPSPVPGLIASRSHGGRFAVVIASGILSTAAALVGVFLLCAYADENIMGWYADYVLPAGAVLVGLAASVGYALASWYTGLKVRRQLLLTIVVLQVLAYFMAHYITFLSLGQVADPDTGGVLGFWKYYHLSTVTMAWKDEHQQQPGAPLGSLGYLLRAGELFGFVLGTLIAPLAMLKASYCETCERYMRKRELAVLPGSTAKAGLFKRKSDPISSTEALESGMTEVAELTQLAGDANAPAFVEKLTPLRSHSKANKKLPRRILLTLHYCGQCKQGDMRVQMLEGHGKQLRKQEMGKATLTPEFVSGIL